MQNIRKIRKTYELNSGKLHAPLNPPLYPFIYRWNNVPHRENISKYRKKS